jgi:hypothetical protein
MRRLAHILALCALVMVTGCARDGSSLVNSVGANVSTDGTTWSAGVVITFKEVPPVEIAKQLRDLGGQESVNARAFTFPRAREANDPAYQKAIGIAASAGDFVVTGTPAPNKCFNCGATINGPLDHLVGFNPVVYTCKPSK